MTQLTECEYKGACKCESVSVNECQDGIVSVCMSQCECYSCFGKFLYSASQGNSSRVFSTEFPPGVAFSDSVLM